ncbi:hypothetical protein AB0B66_08170 [Catellatospora sp. NPDC049111]|uniref:hypothetical protein n=1 Tax=Catellatospora sp. NPDC049111 TaxID=3155271 RepID=UPI0033E504EF
MTYAPAPVCEVSGTVPDAPWLNCDNAHLAALMQFYGAAAPSAPMGMQWHFALPTTEQVPVTLRVAVLDAIAAETGIVFDRHRVPIDRYYDTVAASTAAGVPLIVYGDAFHMPWLPYFGNDSSAHPTILAGVVDDGETFHLVEAYTNSTPWGRVVPGPASVTRQQFQTLVEALPEPQRGEVIVLRERGSARPHDPADMLRANAEGILRHVEQGGELARYAEWGRAAIGERAAADLFDLGCWEVTRARSCHASWLVRLAADRPDLVTEELARRFATEVDEPWRRVSQFAFVNAQRVARGSRPAVSAADLIADRLVAAEVRFAYDLLEHLTGRSS